MQSNKSPGFRGAGRAPEVAAMAGSSRPGPAGGSIQPRSPARYLSLDPLPPVAGEGRQSRAAELRRVLGVPLEAERPPGLGLVVQAKPLSSVASEELRRISGGVAESSARATERGKSLQECIRKLDRYRNVVTPKRQRSEGTIKRSSGARPGAPRVGAQNGNDNPGQRPEERAKSAVATSKHVRSLPAADTRSEERGNAPTRQSPLVENFPLDKAKSFVRTPSTTTGFSEDKLRGLSPGGEGWEKKLKRKRSVGTTLDRGNDVGRAVRPLVHKTNNEVCARSTDGHPFRHGASTGAGGSKMDGSSQQGNAGSRYIPKMGLDSTSLSNERRGCHVGLDKEQVLARGNKAHMPEDVHTRNLSIVTKGKACRPPRIISPVVMNSSSTFQRSAWGGDECEEVSRTNKASPLRDTMNGKHPIDASGSPPPFAWVGQRPKKMSRTRRANVVSPVSNFDGALSEGSPVDVAIRPAITSSSISHSRGAPSNNTQAVPRIDNSSSPTGLSESEGSAITEKKNKKKFNSSGDFENEGTDSARALFVSNKKSRILLKEELGDGSIHRQERSGRSIMHVKGCTSMSKDKLDSTDTRKLPKNRISVSEKNESKLGRPLMKKSSDREASSRHSGSLNGGSMGISAEREDDREELLAAANAARNGIVGAYGGPFWKKIEPMLTFISSEDLSYLKKQITFLEDLETDMCDMTAEHTFKYSEPLSMGGHSSYVLPPSNSSVVLEQTERNDIEPRESVDILSYIDKNHRSASEKIQTQGWFREMNVLTHRLLSAFILEDSDDFSEHDVVQRDMIHEFSNDYLPYAANRCSENEFDASAIQSSFGLNPDFKHSHNNSVSNSISNGFMASSNLRNSYSQNTVCSENISDGNFMVYPENVPFHELTPHISQQYRVPGKQLFLPSYGQMSLHDRILIELHSIDIVPEMPELDEGEDEDINKLILELQKRLFEQMNQKKCHLHKLDKAIRDAKSMEERSLEQHAMNKLVEMAYKKLMGGQGSSSHKVGLSKASKHLALAFAKRTLARCQEFEETGKSCFSDPSLWSVLSAPLPENDAIDGAPLGSADRPKPLKLDRSPLSQGCIKSKKGDRERDRNPDAPSKNCSSKSGRNPSGNGRCERKTKIKPKHKVAQLSTSGSVLGRATESPPTQRDSRDRPDTCNIKPTHPVRNTNTAQESLDTPQTNLPPMDPMDILDVPEGNDISAWFTDGLDDSLQDFDFSGGLEIPDDDLTQLAFM